MGDCETQGKYAEAEPLFRRALAIKKKALGPDHPHAITIRNHLNDIFKKM
ncbi:MAG: tetratricopeptide repeat protein [Chlorobiaceae bacterium]